MKCVGARHWLGCRRLTKFYAHTRAHTHIYTEYICTQEPHFSITYNKSSTAHKLHVKNKMHKIMCCDCHRQATQVWSTHSKPYSNVDSVTHVTVITNNYLSCTQKIQLHLVCKTYCCSITIKQLNSYKQFNFLGLHSAGMLCSVGW